MAFITPKNIPKFIIFLPIIGILITTILLSFVTIYTIKTNFEKEKENITKTFFNNLQNTTKQRVNLTYNIIDALYKDKKNYKQTIESMRKVLSKMRWDKKGYIFVFDYKGNTLYHPNHHYMTINRWNFERNGVKVIRVLIQEALKHPKGTYVKYLAYNPDGSPKQKVSYVKIYKPLNIVIGNGVYLNYLDKKLLKKQNESQKSLNYTIRNIIITSFIILVLMLIIIYYFSSIVKDLFKKYNKEINQEKAVLFRKANFDLLTNLHNRAHFLLELQEHLNLIKTNNKKLAILFIDLDHFKEINDTLGHQYGDKVLKTIANRIKKIVRNSDIVSRFGGDEFVVLLYDIESSKITDLIEPILNKIKEPIILNKEKYYLSASIGISIAPIDSEEADKLVKYSDTAMYKAKKAGKDRFEFYTNSMSDEANKRIILKNSLYQALENKEFLLYFQPQIDKNEDLYGMEVLIRWNHPTEGVLSPYYFIPLAIEIGIIDKIDLWVIEQAIIQHKKWIQKGKKVGVMSCNMTIQQLEKGNFVKSLDELFKKHSFKAENLNLELTEESIMKNPKKSIDMINRIKELGIKINIDDFGTGYSSLAYLKKLPISKLKIDRSFIKDIPNDKDDEIITKTIINLAKNLHLKIVAEGVETEVQRDFVFENGGEFIQGYFYSQPIPADEFEKKFLKDNNVNK